MTPAEQQLETKIASLGLNAPRITPQRVDELMAGVQYSTHLVPGTTTVLATAIMPSGFTLCTVESACASPANFKLQLGIEIAIRKATDKARDELRRLEAYRLSQTLHEIKQGNGERALETIRETIASGGGSSPAPSPGTGE